VVEMCDEGLENRCVCRAMIAVSAADARPQKLPDGLRWKLASLG
jgi:hypothetical protein